MAGEEFRVLAESLKPVLDMLPCPGRRVTKELGASHKT